MMTKQFSAIPRCLTLLRGDMQVFNVLQVINAFSVLLTSYFTFRTLACRQRVLCPREGVRGLAISLTDSVKGESNVMGSFCISLQLRNCRWLIK